MVSRSDEVPSGRAIDRVRRTIQRGRGLLRVSSQVDFLVDQVLESRHQLLESALEMAELRTALYESRHLQLDRLTTLEDSLLLSRHEVLLLSLEVERLEHVLDLIREEVRPIGRSVTALGESMERLDRPQPDGFGPTPLVSVVFPVRDRADIVADSVHSVLAQTYANWELLVVDDGSTDSTMAAIADCGQEDPRIRFLVGSSRGVAAARNVALRAASGDLVAYLDSDNRWLPSYLARVVDAFDQYPQRDTALAQQLVVDDRTGDWMFRDDDRPLSELRHGNFMDLNSFSHRRSLLEERGGFDEDLRRLSDWDLALRYTRSGTGVIRIAVPGCVYRRGRADQISLVESLGWHLHLVHRKHVGLPGQGIRVLLAEWHYPQLSESYIQADIDGLRSLGVEVAVWSEEMTTAAPYESVVPVLHGDLAQVVDQVQPHVVLVHWLNIGEQVARTLEGVDVPVVVRGHGYEFSTDRVDALIRSPGVKRVYLFPHLAAQVSENSAESGLVKSVPVSFDAQAFVPYLEKDRTLVLRAGVALPSKQYECFFETAAACPDHRFLLCLVHPHKREHHLDDILDLHAKMASQVEVRVDVPREEMAALMGESGIYLHTHSGEHDYGMPISIAEAMATGAYVLAPDLPGSREFLGGAGAVYSSVEDAATLIRSTATWADHRWRTVEQQAIDRAFREFTDLRVAEVLLDDWVDLGLVSRSMARAAYDDGELVP